MTNKHEDGDADGLGAMRGVVNAIIFTVVIAGALAAVYISVVKVFGTS